MTTNGFFKTMAVVALVAVGGYKSTAYAGGPETVVTAQDLSDKYTELQTLNDELSAISRQIQDLWVAYVDARIRGDHMAVVGIRMEQTRLAGEFYRLRTKRDAVQAEINDMENQLTPSTPDEKG